MAPKQKCVVVQNTFRFEHYCRKYQNKRSINDEQPEAKGHYEFTKVDTGYILVIFKPVIPSHVSKQKVHCFTPSSVLSSVYNMIRYECHETHKNVWHDH